LNVSNAVLFCGGLADSYKESPYRFGRHEVTELSLILSEAQKLTSQGTSCGKARDHLGKTLASPYT